MSITMDLLENAEKALEAIGVTVIGPIVSQQPEGMLNSLKFTVEKEQAIKRAKVYPFDALPRVKLELEHIRAVNLDSRYHVEFWEEPSHGCCILVLSQAEKGSIKDYISQVTKVPDMLARHITHQLVSSFTLLLNSKDPLLFLPQLSFQNVLVDSMLRVVLCGWGQAVLRKDAPTAKKVQLFLGELLFMLAVGNPPFFSHESNDPHFKFITQTHIGKFWRSKKILQAEVSPPLIELISNLFLGRFNSLDQIMKSTWFQTEAPDFNLLQETITKIEKDAEAKRQAKRSGVNQRHLARKNALKEAESEILPGTRIASREGNKEADFESLFISSFGRWECLNSSQITPGFITLCDERPAFVCATFKQFLTRSVQTTNLLEGSGYLLKEVRFFDHGAGTKAELTFKDDESCEDLQNFQDEWVIHCGLDFRAFGKKLVGDVWIQKQAYVCAWYLDRLRGQILEQVCFH